MGASTAGRCFATSCTRAASRATSSTSDWPDGAIAAPTPANSAAIIVRSSSEIGAPAIGQQSGLSHPYDQRDAPSVYRVSLTHTPASSSSSTSASTSVIDGITPFTVGFSSPKTAAITELEPACCLR